jgi:hypothetical protein
MRKFIFGLFILVIFSCKKKDETPPEVSIISLNASSILSFGDTIWVEVEGGAHDDFGLQSVTVRVQDLQQNSWLTSDARQLSGASSTRATFAIVINDRYLPSGTYVVKAFLNDGTHVSTDFVTYTVNGLSLQSTGIAALDNNGFAGAIIDTLSSNGTLGSLMYFLGSREQVLFEPYSQQFWTSGEDASQYQWSASNGMLLTDQAIPTFITSDFFTDAAVDPQRQGIWAACADGHVRRFHPQGTIGADFSAAAPTQLALTEDFVIVESEGPGAPERVLFFHPTTGQLLHTWVHGEEVLDMAVLEEQLVLVVQRLTGVELLLFDLNTMLNINWSNFYAFNATTFFACDAQPNRLALSTDQGLMVWDGDGNVLRQWPGVMPVQLEWNHATGNLYGLYNGQVQWYALSNGAVNNVSAASYYTDFTLMYNK